MKKIISLILIIPTLLLVGCTKNNLQGQNIKSKDKKIKIYTSIYPLYDFTNKIGGKKVDVVNLVPAGVEPHDWEMSTNDMINLEKSDMLIYNGAGIENWIDKVVNNLDNKDIVYVKTSENLDLHKIKNEDGKETYDPHTWLSIKNAKLEMKNIKDALVKYDPDNKDLF